MHLDLLQNNTNDHFDYVSDNTRILEHVRCIYTFSLLHFVACILILYTFKPRMVSHYFTKSVLIYISRTYLLFLLLFITFYNFMLPPGIIFLVSEDLGSFLSTCLLMINSVFFA